MISITVTPDPQKLATRFGKAAVLRAIASGMDLGGQLAVGTIRANRLSRRSNNSLGRREGRLYRSLGSHTPRISGDSVTMSLGTNVKYAAVHEFGSKPYTIRPKSRRALAFSIGGVRFVRGKVRHPGHKARRWLSGGLQDAAPKIETAISQALGKL